MESKPNNVEELLKKIKEYLELRLELFRLKSISKASKFVSSFITLLVVIILFSFSLFAITIGLGLLIGEWVGKIYLGFFIVAVLYIIIGLIIYSMKDKIILTKVSNKMIKEMTE